MRAAEAAGDMPESYRLAERWIGDLVKQANAAL